MSDINKEDSSSLPYTAAGGHFVSNSLPTLEDVKNLEKESKRIEKDIDKLDRDFKNMKERIDLLVSDKIASISDNIDSLQIRLERIVRAIFGVSITFIIGVIIIIIYLSSR